MNERVEKSTVFFFFLFFFCSVLFSYPTMWAHSCSLFFFSVWCKQAHSRRRCHDTHTHTERKRVAGGHSIELDDKMPAHISSTATAPTSEEHLQSTEVLFSLATVHWPEKNWGKSTVKWWCPLLLFDKLSDLCPSTHCPLGALMWHISPFTLLLHSFPLLLFFFI